MQEPGAVAAAGSQSPVAIMGPPDQGVTRSPGLEPLPGVKGRELPGPAPMEMDASDPPWGAGRLVYFISEVLHEAKTRYLEVHKLLYAVLITSKKLRHYFQAHRISVVTPYPLRAVLRNPNATGNINKWAAKLAEFELNFVPHHAVKSQVLADFIVDWTPSASPPGGPDNSEPEPRAPVFTGPHWTLFFDGSSHKQGAGAGVVLLTPHGD
jgi:hypothetical protein